MAKNKNDDIYEKAEKLGIKKENVEFGLSKDETRVKATIDAAYNFKYGKKRS